MATVVTKRPASERKAVARPSGSISSIRVRRRPRPRSRFQPHSGVVIGLAGLAFFFCYINLYANLTTTSYSRVKLNEMCRQEKITNEQLKIKLARLSSPHNVVLAAQNAGMVYATHYDYLPKPQAVASAAAFGRKAE